MQTERSGYAQVTSTRPQSGATRAIGDAVPRPMSLPEQVDNLTGRVSGHANDLFDIASRLDVFADNFHGPIPVNPQGTTDGAKNPTVLGRLSDTADHLGLAVEKIRIAMARIGA